MSEVTELEIESLQEEEPKTIRIVWNKEPFCSYARRLAAVGKTLDTKEQVKASEKEDQRVLKRNHKLWSNFHNNIYSDIKKLALQGKESIDLPVDIFPIRDKIIDWAVKDNFNVTVTTEKEFPTQEETLAYLNDLFEDAILEKKVYFLMTLDWKLPEEETE